jgi:3-hydroxybutyryl-CoA dehydratase
MTISNSQRKEGDVFTGFERQITQDRVDAYAKASGDHNPIHLNEEYASTTQFGTRIAHGMLSLALVTEMLASEFPDSWYDGAKLKVRFNAPVFPGEIVTTYGEITTISQEDGQMIATCTIGCKKTDGTDAVAGQATVPLE